MINYINYYNNAFLWSVILIAGRIYGALYVAVLFNEKWFTKASKLLLSFVLAIIIYPYCNSMSFVSASNVINIILLCKELVIGAVIGYMFSFPFWVIQNVGNIMDMQRGEQFGAIINQTTNNPSSSIGNLLLQSYIVYLVSINGMIFFIQLLFCSFKIIKVGSITIPDHFVFGDYEVFIKYFADYFYWVVVLVLPILASMFLLDMVFGFIGAFVPAMNITMLAMPLKGLLALFLLTFYVGILFHVDTVKFLQQIKIYFAFTY